MKKVLIVNDLHPVFIKTMEQLGWICDYEPNISYVDCKRVIGDYTGLVVRTKFNIDQSLLEEAHKLRFIGRAGAGLDNIDLTYADKKGIHVINAPEGNRDALGEHALGMILSLSNNLIKGDTEIRNGIWDREGNRGWELKGKTVGIIGYGNMGGSFARKLSGFDVTVLAYDKYKTGFSDAYAREAGMEELFAECDVLSLHIPLTDETRQMVNAAFWNSFVKSVLFINTARGEIVDTQALLTALAEGKVRGAGLDVLEMEKFPPLSDQAFFEELVQNDKVLLSPHVAGWSVESYKRISEVLAQKVALLY